jgi:hypothetical protein
MASRRFFTCKYPNEIHELMVIHPYLLVVFAGLVAYCHDRSYPAPVITSIARTPEENEADGAESDSHVTLRAFDVRSSSYTQDQVDDICEYMNREFSQYAAVNNKGARRLAVYHKVAGGALHFHFQIHRRFALEVFKGME